MQIMKKTLYLFMSLCLGLFIILILEAVFSIAGIGEPAIAEKRFSLNCDYKLAPHEISTDWRTKFKLNSNGLREEELSAVPKSNEVRVLFLGDSCTFGVGDWVDPDETYVKLSQKQMQLRNKELTITGINAGIPGYSSFQGLQLFKQLMKDYSPDIVTVYYGWNDHWVDDLTEKDKYVANHIDYYLNKSRIFSCAKKILFNRGSSEYVQLARHSKIWPMIYKKRIIRVNKEEYRNNLISIINICKKNNANVVLFTAPYDAKQAVADEGWFKEQPFYTFQMHPQYNEITRDVAKQQMVYIFDLANLFPENKDGLFCDSIHFTRKGHSFVAAQFCDFLEKHKEIVSTAGRFRSK